MSYFTYTGANTDQISFPLGGIGSGCIGLAGNGRLIDWEIFSRPNKGSLNGFSHFAIKAEADGKVLDARILHGDLQPPYKGSPGGGVGPARETLAGMPHFKEAVFEGKYPFANLQFKGARFPGKVSMLAFNPFIPLNERDSSIPAAFFEFTIENPSRKTITYTVASTLGNPLKGKSTQRFRKKGKLSTIQIRSSAKKKSDPEYGDLTIATDASVTSYQEQWFRGGWFDTLEVYWRDLTARGRLRNRAQRGATNGGNAILAAHVKVKPGQTRRVRFVISWNMPNCENYWNRSAKDLAKKARITPRWRNYYATVWKDSIASAAYCLNNWNGLYDATEQFHHSLFSSTLPAEVLDAVSANISILKSPTVLRLEDGTLYGFEGCHTSSGCCEGSCTHVWNYAQALPFLFPKLARRMREVDYKYNQQKNGGMPFRMMLPLGIKHPGGISCADGLFGNVMLVYRDWKISGDSEWLRSLWPRVKKSIEFAWADSNGHRWDPEKTGVLTGRQHHTLDMELFGPSSWLCGFYLGALKAAAEMADHLGEQKTATEYQELFMRGQKWLEKNLFNGEYYQQKVNIRSRAVLAKFDAVGPYWDAEHKQIKYQIDQGCSIDQTLAQYHANLYGLGNVFDRRRTKKALKSLFKYNFHENMRDTYNPCRLYSLNDEAGLAICSWPEGKRKPAIPITYAQETMHGFEYAAAVQMIQNGLVKEGLAVVKSIRDRYDGERRNPWNEFECGNNYARSMASYALLNAFSGFEFDMARGLIGFRPVASGKKGKFRCFWSLACGWGTVEISGNSASVKVIQGKMELRTIRIDSLSGKTASVSMNGRRIESRTVGKEIRLQAAAIISAGSALRIKAV